MAAAMTPRVIDISHPYKNRGLTAKRLSAAMSYDKETGEFRWLERAGPKPAGSVAGSINSINGYRYIGVDGEIYLAQCLAWLHVTGEWPAAEVDHKDLDHDNNRWGNLREATAKQNCANRPKRSDSSNPYKGISRKGRKWRAQIVVSGRRESLGYFDKAEDAHAAYIARARQVHRDYARAA